MKEFDKRIKNKEYTWCGVPIDKEISDMIAKQIWKEALGWALSSGSWENIVCNIKEELKENK